MDVRVELGSDRLDLLDSGAPKQFDKEVAGHAHATQDLAFVVMFGRIERPLEVVENRQQLSEQVPLGALAKLQRLPEARLRKFSNSARRRSSRSARTSRSCRNASTSASSWA